MNPGMRFTKVWFDNDMVELQVDVSDGVSLFSNRIYVGHSTLAQIVNDLEDFKVKMHGGLLDIRLGEFGPEYASGALHARFHFPFPGRLFITSKQQSEFRDFSVGQVASEATLYLKSEPVLLDNFIGQMKGLKASLRDEAYLEAIN
jgi:hypothetical protein